MRVLYIEDNAADADLAARDIARRSPHIAFDIAPTLREARKRLEMAASYDLVLTDVNLPDGNGLDLLAEVRRQDLPLAVVVLTGADAADIGVAALKAGADDYLVKRGGYTERLGSTLEAALERYRSERDRRSALRVLYATDSHAHGEMTLRHFETHARNVQLDLVASIRDLMARLPQDASGPCPYDVLLIEVQTVRVETLDSLRSIRGERGLDIPVVVVCGENDGEVAVHVLRFGASDYLAAHPGYLFALPAMLQSAHSQASMTREQEKLRASERHYRNLVEATPGAVFEFLVEPSGKRSMPFVSEGVIALVGLTPAEVEADGESVIERIPGEAREAFEASVLDSRQALSPWVYEFPIRNVAGEIVWLRGNALPHRNADGSTLWHGVLVDITERRRAEDAVLQSEDRYRDLVENSLDLICTHDVDGNLLSVNSAANTITGYPVAELLRMNLGDLLVPEARPLLRPYLDTVLSTGTAKGVMVVHSATGEVREWEYHNTLRAEPGAAPVIRGMARDVTDQRRAERKLRDSEAQFRATFHASPVPMVIVTLEGQLREVNDAFKSISGYLRDEAFSVAPRGLGIWTDEDERARFHALVRQGLAVDFETPFRAKDGRILTVLLSGSMFPIGGVQHILIAAVDITARKAAEVAVQESEAKFRAVFANSPVSVALLTVGRVFVDVNQAFVEAGGYEREEVIGRGVTDVGLWFAGDDRTRFLEAFFRDGRISDFETVIRRKDGRLMQVLLSATAVPVGGAPHILVSTVDVTARAEAESALRESEQKFRAVFDLSPNPLVLSTVPDGVVVATNIPPSPVDGSSAVGGAAREFGWWPDAEVRAQYLELLGANGHVDGFEAAMLRRDGRMMTALVSGRIVTIGGQLHNLTSAVDITERKQAEDALLESQRRYERVVEHISDALIIDDLDGKVVFANGRFFEVFGIPPAPDRAIVIQDYVAPEWKERLEDRHRRRMAGEEVPSHFEYEGVRGDGRRIWLEVDVARIVEDGQAIGTQSTMRDITDRKLTERAMALLSTGVAHLRGEAFFGEVASQIAQLLGVEIGFIGRLMPTPEPRIRTLGMSVDGAPVGPVEYDLAGTPCERVIGKETSVFPSRVQQQFPGDHYLEEVGAAAYAAVPLFDLGGRPIGHIGVMSREPIARTEPVEALLRLFAVPAAAEIERQRTEAQFENLFHYAPDGIVMVDAKGIIVEANPQAEALFGYTRPELLGLPVMALVPEASRGEHTRAQQGFMSTPTSRKMGADRPGLTARRKDGTVFPTEISISPIQGEDGVVVVATIRDMSERAQAEEDRRVLEGQLWQAQKMEAIGTLAGGIAHDFNNILAAIIGNTELAAMDIEPGHPAAETLDEIRQASTRAKDLVRQILAFSRHQEQPRNAISLGPVVEEVAKLMRAALPASVEIRTHVAAGTPTVMADPSQIHQVLMNLCTNGWHAMDGNPGKIDVRLESVLLDAPTARRIGNLAVGRYARLSVSDSGKGMDQATAERVFEPFFTTKEVGSGTGLGLAVVHGIIRSHGGEITVQSSPGEGATFDAYLPASVVAEAAPVVEDNSLPRGQGQHVLYVDDERALVTLATRLLERLGYRVTSFGHPDEALAALRVNPRGYDVLLTDLNMPGVSGLELIREALSIAPHLPAILLSGYTDAEIRSTAESAGVRAELTKPTSSAELAAALRAAVTGEAGASALA